MAAAEVMEGEVVRRRPSLAAVAGTRHGSVGHGLAGRELAGQADAAVAHVAVTAPAAEVLCYDGGMTTAVLLIGAE